MTDSTNLVKIIQQIKPEEIYNLGAQSHVKVSFEMPEYTGQVDGLGTLRVLEAVRLLGLEEHTRIYQASTSELYGLVQETPQTEKTPFSHALPMVDKICGLGSSKTIESHMECIVVLVSSSIMNLPVVVRPL